jgi:hypothetical protein
MRTIGAAFLATALVASNAFAAGSAPLPSGKPAGIKEAANLGPDMGVILLGAGIVIGGIVFAVSGNEKGITSGVSTTTGSGLP